MKPHQLIVSFFSAFSHFAIRHPRRTLVIAAIVTLAVAPGVMRLKLRTAGHALVSEKAPEVVYDKSIRDLTAEFAGLPGVNASDIMSLANHSFRAS